MSRTPERAPQREHEPQKETPKAYTMSMAVEASPKRGQEDPCQDSAFIDPAAQAAGVFDGVGGAAHSEIAAAIASLVSERDLKNVAVVNEPAAVEQALTEILQTIHATIRAQAEELKVNMCTTGVIVKIFSHAGQDKLAVAWVGDSRAYRVADEQTDILTLDDAVWLKFVPKDQRRLEQYHHALAKDAAELESMSLDNLTVAEDFSIDNRLTQSLGMKGGAITPHVMITDLEAGDQIVLATDGLNPVSLDDIAAIASETNPQLIPQTLISKARDNCAKFLPKGKTDDCAVVRIGAK